MFLLFRCVVFSILRGAGPHFASLLGNFGMLVAYYGGLVGHFGGPGRTLGSTLMFLGSTWAGFWGPWKLLGLILELLGSILGCLGHPKLAQSGPGWHLADLVETYENTRVFYGLRGWRLPSWHQNDVLEALAAHPGCPECFVDELDGWLG